MRVGAPIASPGRTLLSRSAVVRVAGVAGVLAVLWLAVAWAVSLP